MVAGPPSARPWRRVGPPLAIGGAVAVAAVELIFVVSIATGGGILVEDPVFQYSTPPTYLCPYLVSTVTPPSSLTVSVGATFILSWTVGCQSVPGANTSSSTFVISSVVSATAGFSVVRSTVPVTFGYGTLAYLNVTVRAPWYPVETYLTLVVQGGPVAPP